MTVTDQPTIESTERPPRQSLPGRAWALLRNTWRGLTSMRTALVLLFLLALAAIPGALLPQRNLNEQKVEQYIADRPTLGPWMDRFELFDVFSSFWFTAVYVLLFISLVGCILPRTLDHYRALRTPPVRAPRNLTRLPHHYSGLAERSPRELVDHARAQLRGWRTEVRPGPREGELALSAEKGYTRELGNLVFHLALVGLLIAIAAGKLFGYEGSVIVLANNGPGFCTTSPAVFDSFKAGNVNDGTGMTPICVRVKDFRADYLTNGQAEMFTANLAIPGCRSTTPCASQATGSTCKVTATRRPSRSPSPTARPAPSPSSGVPTTPPHSCPAACCGSTRPVACTPPMRSAARTRSRSRGCSRRRRCSTGRC
jgi:cytochrome c biogenesis protein